MPGRKWYLVALLLVLLGLGAAALYFFPRFATIDSGVVRMVAPGETVMPLKPGAYTVFHEYSSVLGGQLYEAHDISGLRVAVATPAGAPVVLRGTADTSYAFAGHKGVSLVAFDIDAPGDYRFSATYAGGIGQQTVLAVGQGFIGRIFSLIWGTIAILVVTVGVGVAIASVTYVKRRATERGDIAARAGIGIRAVEGSVDFLVCLAILYGVAAATGNTNLDQGSVGFEMWGMPALAGYALCLVYFIVFEALAGATIGKFVTGLRVVMESDGAAIGWAAAAIRNLYRFIDGFVLYMIGFLTICFSRRHQRLGDIVAGTIVIHRR
jgi:uncharacterized RDD family membrane protein YckC